MTNEGSCYLIALHSLVIRSLGNYSFFNMIIPDVRTIKLGGGYKQMKK
jgi:hypothetical protein